MYVWASNYASQRGYAVENAYLAETTEWLITNDEARIFRQPTSDRPAKLSQATILLSQALQVVPHANPLRERGAQRIKEHLQAVRHGDHWVGSSGRPPIFNTPQVITRQTVLALAGQDVELVDAANRWLISESADETHQGLVLRLWAAANRAQCSAKEIDDLVARLISQQRPDGGWAQSAELESDAFATGQTLFALNRAGLLATDLRVQRAINFLARTQRSNGSWPMTSRPDPQTGVGASLLSPITYAATAWSVLGLAAMVPGVPSQGSSSPTSQTSSTKTSRAISASKSSTNCPPGECPGNR